ncbi:target of Myb protein 1 isoform X2 [Stegastes partitus]|uniref:Target of Myb protein 1 isoform X2 n=1 Tax=Stegastes partitus TaxID=144197 RepID=A0A9Y4JRT0_9TELE|nr:PREDICTED: target of Myb protein 1-like isoform X2 [Stegastes partitus]
MFSLGEKMEFLIGNPFSTPVGQRIEQATIGSLQSEDWGLNMEICDIINETDEGPRDAVKAIKKRIVGNKNFREIMLALTVLEACVKNCGHRFHVLVASQEFVEGVLVRSILPKYNPPAVLHDRVLSLIQSWADAFRSSPSLVGVVYVYDDLRRRGLEFPMTDLDALSPIHTPNRSIPENGAPEATPVTAPTSQSQPAAPSSAPSQSSSPPVQPSEGPASLSAEQEQKLRSELALVKGNLTVMSEMLNELKPGQSQPDDTELLQQLFSVCQKMQTRVVELIPQLIDEGFIEELLVVNDDLNNAFIRYERFDRLNKAQIPNTQQSSTSSPIDLSPEPSTVRQPAVIATSSQSTKKRRSLTCLPKPEAAPWQSRGKVSDMRIQELWRASPELWTQGCRSQQGCNHQKTPCRTISTNGCLMIWRTSLQFVRESPVKSLISFWRIGRRRRTTAARQFAACRPPHPDRRHRNPAGNRTRRTTSFSRSECANEREESSGGQHSHIIKLKCAYNQTHTHTHTLCAKSGFL